MNLRALGGAAVRGTAVFLIIEALLERGSRSFFGFSIKAHLPVSFGIDRTAVYIALTACSFLTVMTLYALLRDRFATRRTAGVVTFSLLFAYTFLIMTQSWNTGFLSTELYLVSGIFLTIELPAALFVGIISYEKTAAVRSTHRQRRFSPHDKSGSDEATTH